LSASEADCEDFMFLLPNDPGPPLHAKVVACSLFRIADGGDSKVCP